MTALTVKTHTSYTYVTSDGREFENRLKAETWQMALDTLRGITMLDDGLEPTSDICSAFYVWLQNDQQQKTFEVLQNYAGLTAHIPTPGFWYYDEKTDQYVDIDAELQTLSNQKAKLLLTIPTTEE